MKYKTGLTGDDVRRTRKRAGLTVQQAAALVWVTPSAWKRWESPGTADSSIPLVVWVMFSLQTDTHPTHGLVPTFSPNPNHKPMQA